MLWNVLVENTMDYGFLGPIVGIAGLFVGAGGALLLGWTRTLSDFMPPTDALDEKLAKALTKIVALLCAIGIFVAWFLAEPANGQQYLRSSIYLAVGCLVAFLIYVGLRTYCGRFRQTLVNQDNKPGESRVIWGGLWLTKRAREEVKKGATVEAFLQGNEYKREHVWTGWSPTLSVALTTLMLLALLASGTFALATAAEATQVALTNKPTRQVFSSEQVPGIPSGGKDVLTTPNLNEKSKIRSRRLPARGSIGGRNL